MTERRERGILVGDLVRCLDGCIMQVAGYGVEELFIKPEGKSNREGQWVDARSVVLLQEEKAVAA